MSASLVDVHVHSHHQGECRHLDPTTPHAARHPLGVFLDTAPRIVLYPVLDRCVGDRHVWILGNELTDLSAKRGGRCPVPQSIAQGMEETGAVARLRDDSRLRNKHSTVGATPPPPAHVARRIAVSLTRFLEVRALLSPVRSIATITGYAR